MKKTFQVSKRLCRVTFALLCGMLFHLVHFAHDAYIFNLQLFALLIITLYVSLDWYEDFAFTKPIEVSLRLFSCFINCV